MKTLLFTVLVACFLSLASVGLADDKTIHKVMLLTGMNNHQWKASTPILEKVLKESGRFEVTVVTSPEASAKPGAWKEFNPDFSSYDTVLLNWNDFGAKGAPKTSPWMASLQKYVGNGGGLVLYHAAGPENMPDIGKIFGLVWQKADFGDRITIDDSGKVVRTPKGQGPGSGHGKRFEYPLKVQTKDHPITAGMPDVWMHTADELWHGQRGADKDVQMQILCTAKSPVTNTNEPMIWTVNYGKGRVVVNRLGHVDAKDTRASDCIGFRTFLLRGCEWTCTGKVTISIPDNFPTADKSSAVAEQHATKTRQSAKGK